MKRDPLNEKKIKNQWLTISSYMKFEFIIWRLLIELVFCSCNGRMDIFCLVCTLIWCK